MLWAVDFFVDRKGRAPVEEFLLTLPTKQRAKVLAIIKMLEEQGPTMPFPYSSQVRGRLRELRTQQGKDKLRILYYGDTRRTFILLHGLVKRSESLPPADLLIAEERMERHVKLLERKPSL